MHFHKVTDDFYSGPIWTIHLSLKLATLHHNETLGHDRFIVSLWDGVVLVARTLPLMTNRALPKSARTADQTILQLNDVIDVAASDAHNPPCGKNIADPNILNGFRWPFCHPNPSLGGHDRLLEPGTRLLRRLCRVQALLHPLHRPFVRIARLIVV